MRPAFILFALAAIVVARPPEAATNTAAALITDTKELALANNIDAMVEKAWQDEGDAEDWGRRRRRRRRFRKSLKKLIKKLVGKAVKDALKDKPNDDKSDGDKSDKPDATTSSDSAAPDPTSTDASSSDSAAPDPTAAP